MTQQYKLLSRQNVTLNNFFPRRKLIKIIITAATTASTTTATTTSTSATTSDNCNKL
jgi:hypothetical protein